jgi:hypothetical protein
LGIFHYKYGIQSETNRTISKPNKEKSSPFNHHDDLGYFGGMRFIGFVVIDDVMPNLQGN